MKRREYRPLAELNITNLADIALTLLLIFLITAPAMRSAIDVAIPKTTTTEARPEEGLVITITKKGEIFIQDKKVFFPSFENELRMSLSDSPSQPVYLRADKDASYGLVIGVVGKIKDAGVNNLGLVVEPEPVEE